MKKFLIISLSLIGVLTLGILEQYWIGRDFKELEQVATELIEETEAHTLTEDRVKEVSDWWTERKQYLHIYIPHDEIRDIDYWLSEAQGYIANKHYDLALAQFTIMLDAAKTIPVAFRFKIENIF